MERYYYVVSDKENKVIDVMIKQDFKSEYSFYKDIINKLKTKEYSLTVY